MLTVFSRQQQQEFPQLFIVGGGGGFSHSTSNPKADKVKLGYPFESDGGKDYVTKKEFPSPKQSSEFFKKRVFKVFHPGLWRMFGFLYMIIAAGYLPNRATVEGRSVKIFDMMGSTLGSGLR